MDSFAVQNGFSPTAVRSSGNFAVIIDHLCMILLKKGGEGEANMIPFFRYVHNVILPYYREVVPYTIAPYSVPYGALYTGPCSRYLPLN